MSIKYENTKTGILLRQPSPFTIEAETPEGVMHIHIKNLGDFSKILVPGCEISYHVNEKSGRILKYDLIAVRHEETGWINLDSAAPNILFHRWLKENGYEKIKPEFVHENSKFDFYAEKSFDRYIFEVKGVYTYRNGAMLFPSGKSKRTLRQTDDLITAAWQGFRCSLVLVIPAAGIEGVMFSESADICFTKLLREGIGSGIRIYVMTSHVEPDKISCLKMYPVAFDL